MQVRCERLYMSVCLSLRENGREIGLLKLDTISPASDLYTLNEHIEVSPMVFSVIGKIQRWLLVCHPLIEIKRSKLLCTENGCAHIVSMISRSMTQAVTFFPWIYVGR
jgi:hypothetical protein